MEYDEVVDVADVVFRFENMLDVVVEFVEVYVREELARPVAERHAFTGAVSFIIVKDYLDEPRNAFVVYAFVDDCVQCLVVDVLEVAFDIAFEDVGAFCPVLCRFSFEDIETVECV